jgi:beta-glucosidase
MVRSVRALLCAGALAAVAALAGSGGQASAADPSCPWMDRSKSPAVRAHQLVRAMTLDQKIAELAGQGAVTVGWLVANQVPAVPAMCLPAIVLNDGTAGVAQGQRFTTAFPDQLTVASTWDRDLQRAVGAAIGREARMKGINVQLAPGVGIARHPLNGRNFEYAGEDPYLAGETGAAYVRGIQSQGVAATVKHYALNDQEIDRVTSSSDADERTMQEIHLPAFEAAVKAGVASVMCSYNRINGTYGCEHPYLLNAVLKKQFGFDGWVMSDWDATHSTVAAANAGLDQEMQASRGKYFTEALKAAVLAKQVSQARLDDMVVRIFTPLFRLGIIDNPPPAITSTVLVRATTPAHVQLALKAAVDGTVLLKNDGALPLGGKGKRLALIGRPASPIGTRDYFMGAGSSSMSPEGGREVVSPLAGITNRAGQDGHLVTYADGTSIVDAVATATGADAAIVFAGDLVAEGADRPSLAMSNCVAGGVCTTAGPSQDDLIAAVAAANPHTIVVLQNGNPVSMPWLSEVDAVLEMWFPGQVDGNAAAALLFGDVTPSGKLPITFPKSLTDGPLRSPKQYPGVADAQGVPHSAYSEKLLVGYRWYDAKKIAPLFPFGFGLSYTTFRYSGLTVKGSTATFTVTNTGRRTGAEVAQLYVSQPASAQEPPKQLRGFQKVVLRPGQSKTLSIRLDERAFQHWNGGWKTASGCYTIGVGGSSASLPLKARVGRGGAVCSAAGPPARPAALGTAGRQLPSTGLALGLSALGATLCTIGVALRRRW